MHSPDHDMPEDIPDDPITPPPGPHSPDHDTPGDIPNNDPFTPPPGPQPPSQFPPAIAAPPVPDSFLTLTPVQPDTPVVPTLVVPPNIGCWLVLLVFRRVCLLHPSLYVCARRLPLQAGQDANEGLTAVKLWMNTTSPEKRQHHSPVSTRPSTKARPTMPVPQMPDSPSPPPEPSGGR